MTFDALVIQLVAQPEALSGRLIDKDNSFGGVLFCKALEQTDH